MDKAYISTRQAAELLGIAVSTVQLWTDSGQLSGWTTSGGHRRITLDSVHRLLEKRALRHKDERRSEQQDRKTLVIVEDDLNQLKLYKQQFQLRGLDLNLIEAKNGFEGLLQIGKHQPSIIITDLLMPGMDGFELLRTLSRTPELERCNIIAVSSLSRDEVDKQGGLPDEVLFLPKPIAFDVLESIILKNNGSVGDRVF